MNPTRTHLIVAALTSAFLFSTASALQDNHSVDALSGNFILNLDGAFSSAPPPFTGEVLQLDAAQVSRLYFDGSGQMWGESTLVFHHPSFPFGQRSRLALRGTYEVFANGHVLIEVDEFRLDANGQPGPVRTTSAVYECYIVQRQQLARCVLHSLVSYQQGPAPRVLPATMSGTLQRQR